MTYTLADTALSPLAIILCSFWVSTPLPAFRISARWILYQGYFHEFSILPNLDFLP